MSYIFRKSVGEDSMFQLTYGTGRDIKVVYLLFSRTDRPHAALNGSHVSTKLLTLLVCQLLNQAIDVHGTIRTIRSISGIKWIKPSSQPWATQQNPQKTMALNNISEWLNINYANSYNHAKILSWASIIINVSKLDPIHY